MEHRFEYEGTGDTADGFWMWNHNYTPTLTNLYYCCLNCGAQVYYNDRFCVNCGTPLWIEKTKNEKILEKLDEITEKLREIREELEK